MPAPTRHEVGETPDGRPDIVMEHLRGRTLAEVSRQQAFSPGQVAGIGAQVADALDAAHEQRMVHRDINPSNLSLNDRGQVKALDFGLAKRVDEPVPDECDAQAETRVDTHSGQAAGTPGTAAASDQTPGRTRGLAVVHAVPAAGAARFRIVRTGADHGPRCAATVLCTAQT